MPLRTASALPAVMEREVESVAAEPAPFRIAAHHHIEAGSKPGYTTGRFRPAQPPPLPSPLSLHSLPRISGVVVAHSNLLGLWFSMLLYGICSGSRSAPKLIRTLLQ